MKKVVKKLCIKVAINFIICMVCTMIPLFITNVYADSTGNKAELTMNGSTTEYATFKDAVDHAGGDATITLLADDTYSSSAIYIGTNNDIRSLTINSINKATLTCNSDADFMINSGGTLTVNGEKLTMLINGFMIDMRGGIFNMQAGLLKETATYGSVINYVSGTVNMSGGVLESAGACISTSTIDTTGTLNLSGGELLTDTENAGAICLGFGEYSIYLSGGKNMVFQSNAGNIPTIDVNSKVNIYGKYESSYFTGTVKLDNYGTGNAMPLTLGETAVKDASLDASYLYDANEEPYADYELDRQGNDLVIGKGKQDAPTGLATGTATITGTTSAMEYAATDTATTWTPCKDSSTEVIFGTWYVRYKETDTKKAGVAAKVIVEPQLAELVSLNQKTVYLTKDKKTTLQATVAPSDTTNPALIWTSSNNSVATVDASGKVTAIKNGTAIITATTADGSGKSAKCNVTVGYKITYKCNGGTNDPQNPGTFTGTTKVKLRNPNRSGYTFAGWYTNKAFTNEIKTIAKGTDNNVTLYAKWNKVKVDKTTIRDLTNLKKKKMNVSFDKVDGATGYEVRYATDKKFTKNATTITTTKTSPTITGVEKGKKYYVQVRAYKLDSMGIKVYGKYSGTMSVKIIK